MSLLEVVILVGVSLQIFGLLCFFIWLQDRPGFPQKGILTPNDGLYPAAQGADLQRYPGVTILKPCHGITDNEKENFENFFLQSYPGPVQVLFAVSKSDAPIVPIIQDLLARYSHVDAEMVLSTTRMSCLPKTDALFDAHQKAKHEIVIWSDSDSAIHTNYVSLMVAALQERNTHVVTTPQMDVGANNPGSALKSLANNADVVTLAMIYAVFNRSKNIAWGHSLGFWKCEVDAISDFWPLLFQYIGDDQGLPHQLWLRGKRTVYKNIYVPVYYADKNLKDCINQKMRWLIPQIAAVGSRLIYFFVGFIAYPTIFATLFLLIDAFSARSIFWFGLTLGVRIIASCIAEIFYLKSFKMTYKYFWTIPLWDLMQVGFLTLGLFKTHMMLGNTQYRVFDRWYLRSE